jgi:hypothetical protein
MTHVRNALPEADLTELVQSFHYALRFDKRGKPRGARLRDDPKATAEWLAEHLRMSNYLVLRLPPDKQQSA